MNRVSDDFKNDLSKVVQRQSDEINQQETKSGPHSFKTNPDDSASQKMTENKMNPSNKQESPAEEATTWKKGDWSDKPSFWTPAQPKPPAQDEAADKVPQGTGEQTTKKTDETLKHSATTSENAKSGLKGLMKTIGDFASLVFKSIADTTGRVATDYKLKEKGQNYVSSVRAFGEEALGHIPSSFRREGGKTERKPASEAETANDPEKTKTTPRDALSTFYKTPQGETALIKQLFSIPKSSVDSFKPFHLELTKQEASEVKKLQQTLSKGEEIPNLGDNAPLLLAAALKRQFINMKGMNENKFDALINAALKGQDVDLSGLKTEDKPIVEDFVAQIKDLKAVVEKRQYDALNNTLAFLEKEGRAKMTTQGIFRQSGDNFVITKARQDINEGKPINLAAIADPHVLPVVFKQTLKNLPGLNEGTPEFDRFLEAGGKGEPKSAEERVVALKEAIQKLPPETLSIVKRFVKFANEAIISQSSVNSMDAKNMAIVTGPLLMKRTSAATDLFAVGADMQFENAATVLLFQHADEIFGK